MKKIGIVLLLVLLIPAMAFATDFSFAFGKLDTHPDVLSGFAPTYLKAGVNYNGLQLIEGSKTTIQALVGGGYSKKSAYEVTNSGNDGTDPAITTWNVIEGIGELKFSQGFGESWIENTDMFTFYASYEGRYDVNKDVSSASTADVAYLNPGLTVDANGRKIMMASTFAVGTKFNYLNDTGVTEDGVDVDLTLQLAPSKLSSDNIAWYSANLELVAGKTLYQLCDNYENNLLSVTLVDRIEANYTDALEDGKIPTFAQGTNSLGNKIRGLSSGEYGSTLNFVNNFDIRVNGPNNMLSFIKGVYPRLIFFFDAGYATGKVYNAVSSTNELVLSTGGQFVMNIMDFADLGMQVAYLIKGENPNHVDEKLVSGVVFGLKF